MVLRYCLSNGKIDKAALKQLAAQDNYSPAVAAEIKLNGAAPIKSTPVKETAVTTEPKSEDPYNRDPLGNLSTKDRHLFRKFGFGDVQLAPFDCVHHAFGAQVKSQPDAIAIEHLGHTITYAELDHRSDCLATTLRAVGVGPNSRVCLLVERGILMVVGVMAVLKAGGVYIPLDGGIVTDSTLGHILQDSQPVLALVLEKYAHRITNIPAITLDDSNITCPALSSKCKKLEDLSARTDLCYLIYTSGGRSIQLFFSCQRFADNLTGTTGKPKGVQVMHYNVTNRELLYFFRRVGNRS